MKGLPHRFAEFVARKQSPRETMSSKRGKLFIGTSGWTYEDWYRRFYPEEIPRRDWLSWYAQEFATTEINGSFYRTPSCEASPMETADGAICEFDRADGKSIADPRQKMRAGAISTAAAISRRP